MTQTGNVDEVPLLLSSQYDGDADPLDLGRLRVGGTEVHYYALCPRKLWWFSHGLEQEHAGDASGTTGHDNVEQGTLLHDRAYPDARKKNILIDDLLRLDFTEGGAIHEIKKSRGGTKAYHATRLQLLYYLLYLKHEKGIETVGVIDWPKEKRRETVQLTPEAETEVQAAVEGVCRVRALPVAPFVPKPMTLCAKCAYQELCWG